MDYDKDFIALLYFITFFLFIFWYYQRTYCVTKPETSNHTNEIQLDNSSHLTRIDNDQQRCSLVPLNVLNSLEYENLYNPLREQPRQQYNTAETSRNNTPTTQATTTPYGSSLNYVELNSSDVAYFSRSAIDDPPPSYEECMMSYRP